MMEKNILQVNQTTETNQNLQPAEMIELPENFEQRLTPQMRQQIEKLVASIDIKNRDFVSNYGAEQQTTLGKFANEMLTGHGSTEIGEAGELLNEAMKQINCYETNFEESKGFFGKIFSNPKKKIQQIRDNYKSVDKKIQLIVSNLTAKKMQISKVFDEFEALFRSNEETYKFLTTIIYAGEIAIKKYEEKLEDMKQNPIYDPQEIRDYADKIERFDKRLYDLKLSRAIAISIAPQIRNVQNSAQQVEDTINKAINTSIPLWQTQMAMALGIHTVQQGLNAVNEVNEVTNRMLLSVSQAGKDLAIESARANQKGVVDIETIRKVNENLIEALSESTRITREGVEKRRQDEKELKELETSLVTAIKDIK